MGVNYFYFGNHASTDFRARVEKWADYYVPSRVVTQISVPGRNGDLIQDTGAYSNFDKSYDVFFDAKANGFHDMARAFVSWLCGGSGYRRLEDSYDPDVFLMARVANQEMLRNWMNMYGRTTVTFNCKPQRFLKTGEEEMPLTSGEDIFNAWMPCYPIFKLTGNGTLNVNGNTIGISNNLNKTIVIDCETQNAYTGTENRNGDIYVTGEFPFLVSGENEITFNNSSCSMIPNWWTL